MDGTNYYFSQGNYLPPAEIERKKEELHFFEKLCQNQSVSPSEISQCLIADIPDKLQITLIYKTSEIANEHLLDAVNAQLKLKVFEALFKKISLVEQSFIEKIALEGRADILSLTFKLDKIGKEITPELIFQKTTTCRIANAIFAHFPSFSLNIDHLHSVKRYTPLFNFCIDKFITQKSEPLPLDFLKSFEPYLQSQQIVEHSQEIMIDNCVHAWFVTNGIDQLQAAVDKNLELNQLINQNDGSLTITIAKLNSYKKIELDEYNCSELG